MNDREIILRELMDVLGEEGCGVSCEEATVFKDAEGRKRHSAWCIGHSVMI